MSCLDCFQRIERTDASPTGTITTLHGLPTYISQPPSSLSTSPSSASTTAPTKGIIVFIPDAFGWAFLNNRLLADTYARAGFCVYLPDFMTGYAVPSSYLGSTARFTSFPFSPSLSSLWTWLYKPYDAFCIVRGIVPFLWHNVLPFAGGKKASHERVVAFVEKLRAASTVSNDERLKLGIAGFCWGGKHALLLAHAEQAHLVDAVFTAHPSLLDFPGDFTGLKKPVSVAVGDGDKYLPMEQVREVGKIFEKSDREREADGTGTEMDSEVVVYPGAGHGFSGRIDFKNPKQVEQSEQAERQAVSWFEKMVQQ